MKINSFTSEFVLLLNFFHKLIFNSMQEVKERQSFFSSKKENIK